MSWERLKYLTFDECSFTVELPSDFFLKKCAGIVYDDPTEGPHRNCQSTYCSFCRDGKIIDTSAHELPLGYIDEVSSYFPEPDTVLGYKEIQYLKLAAKFRLL